MKLRNLISCVLILALLAAPVQAAAAGTDLVSGVDAAAILMENRQEELMLQKPNEGTGAKLPDKYDLRELGVVTPVKFQNPFGTCWGFAAIAAAETSILSELGQTYEETGMDLSEHHLTYFARVPVEDETQGGEGWHMTDPDMLFDRGGTMFMASSVFSSGVGVVKEDLIPYRGQNSNTDSVYFINYEYSKDDDWTLPEEYRLVQSYELEEANLLPSPAVYRPTMSALAGSWDRQTNYLGYDATATENIKKELLNGRAVSIAFAADQAQPGIESPIKFLNVDTWAHYTFNGAPASHAVTIVGYDDNYSAQNFLDHTNDPHGDGLPHLPEGNGAWIVKNSWGADTEDFPNNSTWGLPNEEGKSTGYFYLSYYDRSICIPESFDFNVYDDGISYMIDQYDYLPSEDGAGWMDANVLKMANVFTAAADAMLRNVSCETCVENAKVTYEVYLMGADDKVPTDGTLAASQTVEYRYAGYHRLALEQPVELAKGQKYAVVVTETADVDGSTYYGLSTNCALNEAGLKAQNFATCLENSDATEEQLQELLAYEYAVGIVNPGESLVYIDTLGGWADWAQIVPEFQKTLDFRYMDLDNFPIKAYLDFVNLEDAGVTELPELKFAEPAGQFNMAYVLKGLLVIVVALIVLIVAAILIIRHFVKLHKHPELKKPKKPKKPSYKQLKAQLEAANTRIAQLEEEKNNRTDI